MGTFACGDVKRRWHTQQRALDLLVYITNNFVLSRAHVLCECISHILYAADVKSQSGIMLPLVHIQKTDYHSLFAHVRGCIREFPRAGAAYVAGWYDESSWKYQVRCHDTQVFTWIKYPRTASSV